MKFLYIEPCNRTLRYFEKRVKFVAYFHRNSGNAQYTVIRAKGTPYFRNTKVGNFVDLF